MDAGSDDASTEAHHWSEQVFVDSTNEVVLKDVHRIQGNALFFPLIELMSEAFNGTEDHVDTYSLCRIVEERILFEA